jgi:23S rRNA (adenine2503-C2)-methyltransferase
MLSEPLSGMPLDELASVLQPLPRFRAAQIFKWIAGDVRGFEEMSNLPQTLRKELAEKFILRPPGVVEKNSGDDGSVKLALQFADGPWVEAVLLQDGSGRRTACLSTQAGCPAGCVFCKTGTTFSRNLVSAEIVEQFFLLVKEAAEISGPPSGANSGHPVSNIVVMGMGEPLLN